MSAKIKSRTFNSVNFYDGASGSGVVDFAITSLPHNSGVVSELLDLGVPHSRKYRWRAKVIWATAPTTPSGVDIYLCNMDGFLTAPDSYTPIGGSGSQTYMFVPDVYEDMQFLGRVKPNGASTIVGGIAEIDSRFTHVVWINYSGMAISSGSTFLLTPQPDEAV